MYKITFLLYPLRFNLFLVNIFIELCYNFVSCLTEPNSSLIHIAVLILDFLLTCAYICPLY